MDSIVKVSFIIRSLKAFFYCALLSIALVLACGNPVQGISQEQSAAISQNCTTIKQTLSQLQHVDSRARTYLGTTYEAIANRFIIPLNVRLIKNNRLSLSSIQSDFIAEQARFRSSYTEYMREMDVLVSIDCQTSPEEFYDQLVVVRDKRAELRVATDKLGNIASEQYLAVKLLKDTL